LFEDCCGERRDVGPVLDAAADKQARGSGKGPAKNECDTQPMKEPALKQAQENAFDERTDCYQRPCRRDREACDDDGDAFGHGAGCGPAERK